MNAQILAQSLSAARLDPRTEGEWLAVEIVASGRPEVLYRGRRTSDGILLLTGGGLREPTACEVDALTVLRTIALDVVRRYPLRRIDADRAALLALPKFRALIEREIAWSIPETSIVP